MKRSSSSSRVSGIHEIPQSAGVWAFGALQSVALVLSRSTALTHVSDGSVKPYFTRLCLQGPTWVRNRFSAFRCSRQITSSWLMVLGLEVVEWWWMMLFKTTKAYKIIYRNFTNVFVSDFDFVFFSLEYNKKKTKLNLNSKCLPTFATEVSCINY